VSRLARAAVHAAFRRIVSGRLEVEEAYAGGRTLGFGPESAALRGTVVVHDPAFYARLARDRSVGLGEAYADGQWDSPDVVAPLRIAALEMRRSIRACTSGCSGRAASAWARPTPTAGGTPTT